MDGRWDHPVKADVRKRVFDIAQPRQGILTLPGRDCRDVRLALDRGLIGPATRVQLVERDPAEAPYIEAFLEAWQFPQRPAFHQGRLCDLEPRFSFDLLYLDYLGNPEPRDWLWMGEILPPRILPDSRLALTVANATRNNGYQSGLERVPARRRPDLIRQNHDRLLGTDIPERFHPRVSRLLILMEEYVLRGRKVGGVDIRFYRWDRDAMTMFLLMFDVGGFGGEEDGEVMQIIRNHLRWAMSRRSMPVQG